MPVRPFRAARNAFRSLLRKPGKRPIRKNPFRTLNLEPLEDRVTPSTYNLGEAVTAFDQGVQALSQQATAIVNQALTFSIPTVNGMVDSNIPMVNETLDQAMNL